MCNQLILEGKIQNQPILKKTKHDGYLCKFLLEFDNGQLNEAIWVQTWDDFANDLYHGAKKEDFLRVEGRLKKNNYVNKNGVYVSEFVIEAISIDLL